MAPYYNPNLPQNPQLWAQQQQQQQTFQSPAYSSHYMQAYMQAQAGYYQQQQAPYAAPAPQLPYTNNNFAGPSSRPFQHRPAPAQPTGQWYQPGNKRCTYKGCSFTGSHSSVEIHMMDRHLIYPPGWDKRKKTQDWDADPSLKGKPVPIQGTNITLDDPERLAAWIAERKNRFPTAGKVEDKKRKMEEAIARGQLTAEDMGMRSDKRRRTNNGESNGAGLRDSNHPNAANARGRGRGRGAQAGARGRGRGGGGAAAASTQAPPPASLPPKPAPALETPQQQPPTIDPDHDTSDSDSDGEPEVVSSKKAPLPLESASTDEDEDPEEIPKAAASNDAQARTAAPPQKRPPPQPKKAPRNPFAERPSLLRNLILPEIRVTVSNLSQAIRFLVDNDFLRGVELKPGEASEAKIQVLGSTNHESKEQE